MLLQRRKPVADEAPDFVRNVLGTMIAGEGDTLPVSALPCDGTYPSATAQWEKRNIALEMPVWDPNICIQCECAARCSRDFHVNGCALPRVPRYEIYTSGLTRRLYRLQSLCGILPG